MISTASATQVPSLRVSLNMLLEVEALDHIEVRDHLYSLSFAFSQPRCVDCKHWMISSGTDSLVEEVEACRYPKQSS